MLAVIKNSSSLVCFAAALFLHCGALECDAQTNEAPLFVIQSPPLPRTRINTPLIAAFPATAQTAQQGPDLETPAPVTSRRGTQRIDFSEPVEVEDDDLLREIKELDESLAEENSENDGDSEQGNENEDDLDRLIEESGDEDDPDEGSTKEEPISPPVTTWSLKPMSLIKPSIRPVSGESPADQSWQLTSRDSVPLSASRKLYAWAAPNIKHNPLYFEDVALERYGQTKGLVRQPIASSLHFLKSAVFLPYYSIYDPINSCDGPLGYCRPGTPVNCVDQRHYFGNPFRR